MPIGTTGQTRIVGLAGSLRRGSFNRQLLEAAAHELSADVEFDIWDGLEHVPPFNEDLEGAPEPLAVAELRRVIREADGVLIATPEYNGSIPGQLKNALDWASRPRSLAVLEGKPVVTLSASPTQYGAARAHADLRKVLGVIGAEVRGDEVAVARIHEQFDEDGGLVDDELRHRLHSTLTLFSEPVTPVRERVGLTTAASRPVGLQARVA